MSCTLEHLFEIYQNKFHDDEKIILIFHFCMLDREFNVVGGQTSQLFDVNDSNESLKIYYKTDNYDITTEHCFLGDEYSVKYYFGDEYALKHLKKDNKPPEQQRSKFQISEFKENKMISDYRLLMKKMKKSIWEACRNYPTGKAPASKCNVYFDISINNNPIGRIEFKLFYNTVPKTAVNFRELCIGKYGYGYQGSKFHHIFRDFAIKGGDITHHDGTGGRSIYGRMFDDENFTHKHSTAGVLSMGNAGPNSNSSQFFITTAATPTLDGKYVVFGEVVHGMDVVKVMESYGSPSGIPTGNIKIEKCGLV